MEESDLESNCAYWLDLVNRAADELEVEDVLERHAISISEARWVAGAGSVALPKAGVILHLVRSGASAFVSGVEFAVAGLPDGASYDGNLPYGVDAADTLMDITLKLRPAMPTPRDEPHGFDAVFPEHRLVIRMDADDMLQSLTWSTTRSLAQA